MKWGACDSLSKDEQYEEYLRHYSLRFALKPRWLEPYSPGALCSWTSSEDEVTGDIIVSSPLYSTNTLLDGLPDLEVKVLKKTEKQSSFLTSEESEVEILNLTETKRQKRQMAFSSSENEDLIVFLAIFVAWVRRRVCTTKEKSSPYGDLF